MDVYVYMYVYTFMCIRTWPVYLPTSGSQHSFSASIYLELEPLNQLSGSFKKNARCSRLLAGGCTTLAAPARMAQITPGFVQ